MDLIYSLKFNFTMIFRAHHSLQGSLLNPSFIQITFSTLLVFALNIQHITAIHFGLVPLIFSVKCTQIWIITNLKHYWYKKGTLKYIGPFEIMKLSPFSMKPEAMVIVDIVVTTCKKNLSAILKPRIFSLFSF